MDEYGNPIPGPSKGFENESNLKSTVDCDFIWLENEFNNDDTKEVIQSFSSEVQNSNNSCYTNEIESNPRNNIIEDFFEEIKGIDLDKNSIIVQRNDDILIELLERCNSFIDIVSRNIVSLEYMMEEVKKNIEISKENAHKAHKCILFENKSMYNTKMANLKKKAHLANFFKIGLSNCPPNPHLGELYDNGRLLLSYNGRFILEECVESNLWNQEFKNKLEQAIHEEVLNKLKVPMLEQHARLGKERESQNDILIKHKIELEMSNIQKELETISNTPFQRLVFQFMDSNTEYDWLHIAKMIDKPYLQCQRFWNLLLKPHISRNKWTKDEDEKLIEIATKYGEKNWQQIAEELGINRNELQCFVHFQKYKKMLNKKGKWSKQEDQKLMEIIKENSIDNLINWQRVYFAMHDEGRTVDQIYNRWMCCLKPGIKKGYLTESEKLIIKKAHEKNLPPSVVSMNLINRTTSQVRNAYQRIILYNENTLRGGWLPEEDKILVRAVNNYAHNEFTWSQVSKQVPGRNPEQCRHRYKIIEKTVQDDHKITVNNYPRSRASFKIKKPFSKFNEESFKDNDLLDDFRQNRQMQKLSNDSIESDADRKLKKSFLDNVYVTNHCNLSSKCELFKYVLDYLGADLIVPLQFVHKDDLIDEGLMSMMAYLKECSNEALTLDSRNFEQESTSDLEFTYEGVDGVLRTSDIINSDLSEVNGLFDIRMKNIDHKSKSIKTTNTVSSKVQNHPLPLYFMGSVPPNFETFRMLSTFMKCLSISIKKHVIYNSHVNFDWDNEESKKLHQRLVAIFRWPAIFSGTVNYNAAKINILVHAKQTIDSSNSTISYYNSKKKKPHFNLKQCF